MLKKIILINLTAIILCFNLVPVVSGAEMAIVNTKRHVYHKINCTFARKCKKSCIKTTKQKAISLYKARPCKICHKRKRK